MKKLLLTLPLIAALGACGTEAPPIGNSIANRNETPVMSVSGVSKVISDSGVARYKLMAEEWLIYDKTDPPRQDFLKGIFLTRLNKDFNVDLYISADTAFCYNNNLWELRGRVRINDLSRETKFSTEELFWDAHKHEMYSNKHMHIITPDRELEGNSFTSNEQFTRYTIKWASGVMPIRENATSANETPEEEAIDTISTDSLAADSLLMPREAPQAQRRRNS